MGLLIIFLLLGFIFFLAYLTMKFGWKVWSLLFILTTVSSVLGLMKQTMDEFSVYGLVIVCLLYLSLMYSGAALFFNRKDVGS